MSQYGIESCMLHDSLKLKTYTVLDNFLLSFHVVFIEKVDESA